MSDLRILKLQAQRQLKQSLALADQFFNKEFTMPMMNFELRGQKAGVAYLQQNEITDINPLVNMGNLREIKLGYNRISDASPVSKLRSKFKVAIEMGSQEVEVDASNSFIKNPILDQSGNKLDITEKENVKNNADKIEILNFNELNNGHKIKVRWGKDAEFFGSLTINIKK